MIKKYPIPDPGPSRENKTLLYVNPQNDLICIQLPRKMVQKPYLSVYITLQLIQGKTPTHSFRLTESNSFGNTIMPESTKLTAGWRFQILSQAI